MSDKVTSNLDADQISGAMVSMVSSVVEALENVGSSADSRLFFPTGIDLIQFGISIGTIGHVDITVAGVGRSTPPPSPPKSFLMSLDDFTPLTADPQKVVQTCEDEWEAHKSDCSAFARAVAADLGISLTGDADSIADQITGAGWDQIADGVAAKAAADAGKFVVAALRGSENVPQDAHGHVAIIVTGGLAHGKYPTGYWGRLGGVGKKNTTINYAWNTDSRDKVHYASKDL